MAKVRYEFITLEFLAGRSEKAARLGYPRPKWIEFAEVMLRRGYGVQLYEARKTFSKYLTLHYAKRRYIVRFSNHAPRVTSERRKDCDFFVGRNNFTTTNTEQAIAATIAALEPPGG